MLTGDLLVFLNDRIQCRQLQIKQLASLLDPAVPSPSAIVVHGLEATGKSLTTKAVLEGLLVSHAIVRSRECITGRHLLERTVIACKQAIEKDGDAEAAEEARGLDGRCENLSALTVQLEKVFRQQNKFVLVFDGIDRQREAPPTLLPALARLGEAIHNLTVIFIVTAPRPRFLHVAGVPHLHFPPYDRSDCLAIVSLSSLPIVERTSADDELSEEIILERQEDDAWLWSRFCGAVWDSLGKGVARDVISFRTVCERLWIPFVQPVRDRLYGPREFSKLLVRNRALFQNENALDERIVPSLPLGTARKAVKRSHELPYHTSYLLIAAYLASYNPSRQDQTLFMKAHERKRRKKGGGTAKGRPSKHRKIQRRLLGPQAFIMERMLAIFHAIVPHPVAGGTGDVMGQIATLASSKLLVKTSATADILDAGTKWRVNVGWEYIQTVAREVGFEVEGFLAE